MKILNFVFALAISFYANCGFCAVIDNSNIKQSAHSEELVSTHIEELSNLGEHGHQMDPSIKEKRCRESPQFDFYDNVVGSVRQTKPQTFSLPLALKRREILQSDFLKKQCETCRESAICKIAKKCELCNTLCKDYPLDIKTRSAIPEDKPPLVGNPLQNPEETGLSEYQDRYYSVGSFGPGPTQSLLARLLNIPRNIQLERLIVLAKNKSKAKPNALPHPVIIDTAHVFAINDGRPAEFDIEVHDVNGKDADLDRLTTKLNRDLDAAIDTKKKMLSDSHLTPEEIDKIIDHAVSQRNGDLTNIAPFVGDTNKQLPRLEEGDEKKIIQEETLRDAAEGEMNLEGIKKKKGGGRGGHTKKHGFAEEGEDGLVGKALPANLEPKPSNSENKDVQANSNLQTNQPAVQTQPAIQENEPNGTIIAPTQGLVNEKEMLESIFKFKKKKKNGGYGGYREHEGEEVNKKEQHEEEHSTDGEKGMLESKFLFKKKKGKGGYGGYREHEGETANEQEHQPQKVVNAKNEKELLESKFLSKKKKGKGYGGYRENGKDEGLAKAEEEEMNPHSRSNMPEYEGGQGYPRSESGYAPATGNQPTQYESAAAYAQQSGQNYPELPSGAASQNYQTAPNAPVSNPSPATNYAPSAPAASSNIPANNPSYAPASSIYEQPQSTAPAASLAGQGYQPAPALPPASQSYQSPSAPSPTSQSYQPAPSPASASYQPAQPPASASYQPAPAQPSSSQIYQPAPAQTLSSQIYQPAPASSSPNQIYQPAPAPSPSSQSYQPQMSAPSYQAQSPPAAGTNYESQPPPQQNPSYPPSAPLNPNYQQPMPQQDFQKKNFLGNNQQYQAAYPSQNNQQYEKNNQQYENNNEEVEEEEEEEEEEDLPIYAPIEEEEAEPPQSDNQYQAPANGNYEPQRPAVAPAPVLSPPNYPTASAPAYEQAAPKQLYSAPAGNAAAPSNEAPYNAPPAVPPYSEPAPAPQAAPASAPSPSTYVASAPAPSTYPESNPTTYEKPQPNYKPSPQGAYYQTDNQGKPPANYEQMNGKNYQPPGTYKQPNNEYQQSAGNYQEEDEDEEEDEEVLVPIEIDEKLPVFGQIPEDGGDYMVGAAKQNITDNENDDKTATVGDALIQNKETKVKQSEDMHDHRLRENWFEQKYHQLRQWVEENVGMEQDVQNETLGSKHKAIVDEFTNIIKNDLMEGRNVTNSAKQALEHQISDIIEDDLKSENLTAPRLDEELNKIENFVDNNKDSIVNLENLNEFKSRFISAEQKKEFKTPESLLGGIAKALSNRKPSYKNIHDSLLGDKWNVIDVNNFGESSTIATSSLLPTTSRKPLIDLKSIVRDLQTVPNLVFDRAEKVADIINSQGNRMRLLPPIQTLPEKPIETNAENIIPTLNQRNQENMGIEDLEGRRGGEIKETVGQSLNDGEKVEGEKPLVEEGTGEKNNDTVGCSLEDLLSKSSEEKMYLKPMGGYGYRESNNNGLHIPTIKELLHPHKKSHGLEKLEELLTPHESRSDGDNKEEKTTLIPPFPGIPELIKDLENLHVSLPPLPTLIPLHKHHPTPSIPKIDINDEEYNPDLHKNQYNGNLSPPQPPINYPPNTLPIPQAPPQQYQFRNFQEENPPQFQQNFQEFSAPPQENFQPASRNAGYSNLLGAAPIQSDQDISHFGKIVPEALHDLNIHSRDVSEKTKPHKMYFVGDGIKLPLHMKKHDDGTLHLSVDVHKLCKCNQTDCVNKTEQNQPHFLDTAVGSENDLEEEFDDPAVGMAAPNLGAIHSELEDNVVKEENPETNLDKETQPDKDIFKRSPDFEIMDKRDIPEFHPRFNNYFGEEYDDVIPIRHFPTSNLENVRSFHDGVKRYFENEHEGYKSNHEDRNSEQNGDVIQKRVGLLTNVLSWMKGIAMEKAKY